MAPKTTKAVAKASRAPAKQLTAKPTKDAASSASASSAGGSAGVTIDHCKS